MAKLKFLHCADIHLDAPFTSLEGKDSKSSKRRQDLKDTFSLIVSTAKERAVDVLLISGDLYEHSYVKKSTINFIKDLFLSISDIKVVIVPGNHDPFIENSYYKNFTWSENVTILTESNPFVVFNSINLCVFGVGFKNFFQDKPIEYSIKPIYPEYLNFLMVHGTVDLNIKQSVYNSTTSKNLNSLGMDYIALGHFHNRIDNIGGYSSIHNPGSPEPLGFDELGGHGVYFGTIEKDEAGKTQLDIEFLEISKRSYYNIEVSLNGANSNEQVNNLISEALKNKSDEGAIKSLEDGLFQVTLKGYTEKGFKIDSSYLQDCFWGKVFYLKIKDETSFDYDFDEIAKEPGLRGLFARKIFSKIENTESEYEKKLLVKALYFGLEALDEGKIEL